VDVFGQSDQQLVENSRAGDVRSFEHLVEKYFGTVYAVAYARVGHRETAEDLTQEVFLRAYLFLNGLKTSKHFVPWLIRITHNLANDWFRKKQRKSELLPLVNIEEGAEFILDREKKDAREMMQDNEQDRAVQEAIFKLPVEQREVVLLRFSENLKQSEIAKRLNIHPVTVHRHLKRALAAMKDSLEPILGDTLPSLRPPAKASVKAVTVIGATAVMSTSAKADLVETAGGAAWLSTVPTASTGILGLLKAITASIATGGTIMGMGKTIAITATAVAVIVGGFYQLQKKDDQQVKPEIVAIKPDEIRFLGWVETEERLLGFLGETIGVSEMTDDEKARGWREMIKFKILDLRPETSDEIRKAFESISSEEDLDDLRGSVRTLANTHVPVFPGHANSSFKQTNPHFGGLSISAKQATTREDGSLVLEDLSFRAKPIK